MPVINKIDVAVAAGTKSISDEESKDYEEDEALVLLNIIFISFS